MDDNDRVGVLVGWSSQTFGPNLILDIQNYERSTWHSGAEPDVTRIFMTRNQAALLANHLFEISGTSPPKRPQGRFGRLFG